MNYTKLAFLPIFIFLFGCGTAVEIGTVEKIHSKGKTLNYYSYSSIKELLDESSRVASAYVDLSDRIATGQDAVALALLGTAAWASYGVIGPTGLRL